MFYKQKYLYHQSQYSKIWDIKYLAPVAQIVKYSAWIQRLWGSNPAWVETISILKNFDTFSRTSVRKSKMNGVARTQLTFQM